MQQNSTFPIKKSDLAILRSEATSYLKSIQWEQSIKAKNREEKAGEDIMPYLFRATNGSDESVSISKTILELKKKLLPDSVAIPLELNKALMALQEGIAIGIWLKDSYYDASGLSVLVENKSNLDSNQKIDYDEKTQTATAFALFGIAYYIMYCLHENVSENAQIIKNKMAGIPEVSLTSPSSGISCMLFYYNHYLNVPQMIHSPQDMIDVSYLYFEMMINEIMLRKGSLRDTEVITDRTYKLEDSDFVINGWENTFLSSAKSVEFNQVQFEQIVGNRDAKHFAKRLIERLLVYDFKTKRNPFQELGGFMPVFMGYGIPGTGKSMLIAAIATKLRLYTEQLGYPFLFHPMPDTLISTFQGGSAERMVEWMKPMQDPSRIIFAPIDDAENNLQERTQQGVSAGVKEVIGVFLRYTEGAYALNYGNSSIGLFTNLPEQLDKAVISRVQGRFLIDGARTIPDFLDQDYLWWKKIEKTMPGFINMKNPDYEFLSEQALVKNLGEVLQDIEKPTHEKVLEIYDKTQQENKLNEHDFYAHLYLNIQKEFPYFSSRDIRNIQKAVSLRLTDFDLPEIWYEKPEEFFYRDYDQKLEMLKELMTDNMKGLSFMDIRRQEVIRYLDNVAIIAQTDFNRQVDRQVQQLKVNLAARKHFE